MLELEWTRLLLLHCEFDDVGWQLAQVGIMGNFFSLESRSIIQSVKLVDCSRPLEFKEIPAKEGKCLGNP